MVEIKHIFQEPPSLAAHRAANPHSLWDTLPSAPEKRDLRRQLNLEQEGLCIYCEDSLLEDEGHVEHIKSKTLNPHLTFDYENLAHSCDGPSHCGHRKKRQVLPVEPRQNANRFFSLSGITGWLSPAIGLSNADHDDAKETLAMLGLNDHPGLARRRQQFAASLQSLATQTEIDQFLGSSPFRWALRCL